MLAGNLQPALNFFGKTQTPGATTGIAGDNIRYLLTKFQGIDGKLTTFPVNLPAGPIGFAAGGEYRHESLKANDSPEVFVGATPIAEIDQGRDVNAGFGELSIPLVSPDMKVPGVYSANIDGAVRFERYSDAGSTWVPKVGFVLLPIKDVALRGSFSKSFIAPTLYETSGPVSQGFTNSFDIGGGSEQAQSLGGSNPNLGNTTADNYTAGIVLSPHQVPGLTINGDFFHVEEKGVVGAIDPVSAITSVNTLGTASPFYSLVHIGSFNGAGVQRQLGNPTGAGESVGNGDNTYVVSNDLNLGRQRIGGVDFGIHYTHDFGIYGSTNVGLDGTYYLQDKVSTLPNSPTYDIIGFYTGQAQGVEQYHLTPSVSYSNYGFTVGAVANYIPSFRDAHNFGLQGLDPSLGGINTDKPSSILANSGQDYFNKIRDYYTIDLLVSYEFNYHPPTGPAPAPSPKEGKDGKDGKNVVAQGNTSKAMADSMFSLKLLDGLKLQFGITNLTNARPPEIQSSPDSSNTDGSFYDLYQRQYFFVATKKF